MTRFSKSLLAIVSPLLLASCSDSGTVTTLDANPSVSIELPGFLRGSEAPDESLISPTIRLSNGANVNINQISEQSWTGTINVEAGRTYTATVSWVENFEGADLPLAQMTQALEIADDGSVVRGDATEYTTDFDTDSDGVSNLQERQAGTDPNSADGNSDTDPGDGDGTPTEVPVTPDTPTDPVNPDPTPDPIPEPEPPVATADVVVPRIATGSAPDIDGDGVTINAAGELTGEWAAAIQSDNSGAALHINNLMIDIDAEAADGTPYRRWAAMHDGTYLYVMVTVDDNGDRNRDSGALIYHDDSLELFLDGDNSKAQSYDENDFHRILPVQLAGADKQSATSGDVAGNNSSQATLGFSFATGPGIGPDGLRRANYEQDVYELRIDIASAGIDLDAPFGFELQVNDDDGGGTRDSKWGWKHPSRTNSDADGTYRNPSLMGTLILE